MPVRSLANGCRRRRWENWAGFADISTAVDVTLTPEPRRLGKMNRRTERGTRKWMVRILKFRGGKRPRRLLREPRITGCPTRNRPELRCFGLKRMRSYCRNGTSSSCSIAAEIVTIRPVMVGISAASGSAIPPFVSRLDSSFRTSTRAPMGSTYSKTFLVVLATGYLDTGKISRWIVQLPLKR